MQSELGLTVSAAVVKGGSCWHCLLAVVQRFRATTESHVRIDGNGSELTDAETGKGILPKALSWTWVANSSFGVGLFEE